MAVTNNAYDGEIVSVSFPEEGSCFETISPTIAIRNVGSEILTSWYIEYYVNEGTPLTYSWEGSLEFNSIDNIILPEMEVNVQSTNEIVAVCQILTELKMKTLIITLEV